MKVMVPVDPKGDRLDPANLRIETRRRFAVMDVENDEFLGDVWARSFRAARRKAEARWPDLQVVVYRSP